MVQSILRHVDLQLGSKFCSAPIEIRQEIYSYIVPSVNHVFVRGDKIAWKQTKLDILQVCKRVHMDVVDFMVDLSSFYVTDLDTLDYALRPSTLVTPDYLTTALSRIRNLKLSLTLPLPAFADMEDPSASTALTNWPLLCRSLSTFQKLRRLDLRADLDEPCSWTLVNERAFLAPLDDLASTPGLQISVNLPKLHPKFESPERHFTPRCPPPSYSITRRLRKFCYTVENSPGIYQERHFQDFPILYDEDSDEDLEDIEQIERRMWENGEDVEAELSLRYPEPCPPVIWEPIPDDEEVEFRRRLWQQAAET